jgi:hypothetical protein
MNSLLLKLKFNNNMNHVIKNANRLINLIDKNKQIIKYGLISNTIFGIFMRGLGDTIQQRIELNHKKKLMSLGEKAFNQKDLEFSWRRACNYF